MKLQVAEQVARNIELLYKHNKIINKKPHYQKGKHRKTHY